MIKVKSKPKENANTVRKKTRWKDFRDNAELSRINDTGNSSVTGICIRTDVGYNNCI